MRLLVLYVLLSHIAFGGARVAMSLAGLELKASTLAIGVILSFFNLVPMFISVSAGRLIDRIGVANPAKYGVAVLFVGVLLPFAAWDLGTLYLAAVLIGLGFMSMHLSIQKAAGEIGGSDQRTMNFSVLAIAFSVSGFLGPLVAGFSIDHIGHREAFGVLAVAPLIAFWGIRGFRFPASLGAKAVSNTQIDAPEKRVLDLVASPELKRLYISVMVLTASWDVLQFLVPLYGAKLGFSASQIGIVLSAFALGSLAVRLAMPWLSKRVSEWPLILAAIASATLVYALYPFFPTMAPMMALCVVLGLGLGCSQPMVLSIIHRSVPPERIGEAVGLRMTIIGASQTFLPLSFGVVSAATGIAPLFWAMSLVAALGGVYIAKGTVLNFKTKANEASRQDDGLI